MQVAFVLAQVDEVTAVLALVRELYVPYGKPDIQAQHQCAEHSPKGMLPPRGWHQTKRFSCGLFFYTGVFAMQAGKQTNGTGTVGDTGLYQRIGMGKGVFILQHILIGGSGTGRYPPKEK